MNNALDTHFARAIRKYGPENFKIELLSQEVDQSRLNCAELFFIDYYDSIMNGYNETLAMTKCGGNTYFSKSKEELQEISKKIATTKIGSKNPNAKAVKCLNIETGDVLNFDTVKECKEYFNEKHHRFITNRVMGTTKGLYKDKWEIVYQDDEFKNSLIESVSSIPDECTGVAPEISTGSVLGNESDEKRSGRP